MMCVHALLSVRTSVRAYMYASMGVCMACLDDACVPDIVVELAGIVMAYIVMAYIVMAYIVMAWMMWVFQT